MDYKDSGVDREGAASWVENLKTPIEQSFRSEILSSIGGFGAMFEAPKTYAQPVWVTTTDGVGTKILLAEEAGDSAFFNIGIDAVAMCVNDLLACRAEPIAFLDYLAIDSLAKARMNFLLKGILEGCRLASCSLIGGETAEMPGFYPKGRLDVAGFSIGVLEKKLMWKSKVAKENLILVGLPSNGFHSNGFTLVRKIMKQQSWSLDSQIEGEILGDYLLRPTKIYIKDCLSLLRDERVYGAAHITGGGLIENLPRFLSQGYQAEIKRDSFETPAIMRAFAQAASASAEEIYATWNMGIGFVFVCEEDFSTEVLNQLPEARLIGQIKKTDEEKSVKLL